MFSRLNEQQATELLANQRVGRLGCITDNGPYIVPINYYFADGCIHSHSLQGMKINALRKEQRACLQVDQIESDVRWRSVLAFGTYEEVVNPTDRSDILNRLLQRFPMLTPVESALANDAGSLSVIVFRIRIERVTGIAEE